MGDDPRRRLGAAGERAAAAHLERCGYAVVDRNYRTRWGELDLVAYDGRVIAFCEVKTRRLDGRAGPPLHAVGPAKQAQVRRMASRWLAERRDRPHAAILRFDAIGVTVDAAGRLVCIEHLEDAF
ncbi:MAG: YraN family protein [Solirubrobacterales bacterium]|nr:YraN family protein [Solirubrobacterales bacterium]